MTHVHKGTFDSGICQECGAYKKYLHYAVFDADEEHMTWLNPEDKGYPPPPLDRWAEYDRGHPL